MEQAHEKEFPYEYVEKYCVARGTALSEFYARIFGTSTDPNSYAAMSLFFARLLASPMVIVHPQHAVFSEAFDEAIVVAYAGDRAALSNDEHVSALAARMAYASEAENAHRMPVSVRYVRRDGKRRPVRVASVDSGVDRQSLLAPSTVIYDWTLRVSRVDCFGKWLPTCEYPFEYALAIISLALATKLSKRALGSIAELPESLACAIFGNPKQTVFRSWATTHLFSTDIKCTHTSRLLVGNGNNFNAAQCRIAYQCSSLEKQTAEVLLECPGAANHPLSAKQQLWRSATPATLDKRRLLVTMWIYLRTRLADLRMETVGCRDGLGADSYFQLLLSMLNNVRLVMPCASSSTTTQSPTERKRSLATRVYERHLQTRVTQDELAIERTAQVCEEIVYFLRTWFVANNPHHPAAQRISTNTVSNRVVFESYYMPLTVHQYHFLKNAPPESEPIRRAFLQTSWDSTLERDGYESITASMSMLRDIYDKASVQICFGIDRLQTLQHIVYELPLPVCLEPPVGSMPPPPPPSATTTISGAARAGRRWTNNTIWPMQTLLQELFAQMDFIEAHTLIDFFSTRSDLWPLCSPIAVEMEHWVRPEYFTRHLQQLQLAHPYFRTREFRGLAASLAACQQATIPEDARKRLTEQNAHPYDVFIRYAERSARAYLFDDMIEFYRFVDLPAADHNHRRRRFVVMSPRLHELLRNLDLIESASTWGSEKHLPFYRVVLRNIIARPAVPYSPTLLDPRHQKAPLAEENAAITMDECDANLALYSSLMIICTWLDLNKRRASAKRDEHSTRYQSFLVKPSNDRFTAVYEHLPTLIYVMHETGIDIHGGDLGDGTVDSFSNVTSVLRNFLSMRYLHAMPVDLMRRIYDYMTFITSSYVTIHAWNRKLEFYRAQGIDEDPQSRFEPLDPKLHPIRDNPESMTGLEIFFARYEILRVYLEEKLTWIRRCIEGGKLRPDIRWVPFDRMGVSEWLNYSPKTPYHRDVIVELNSVMYTLLLSDSLPSNLAREGLLAFQVYAPSPEDDACFEALDNNYNNDDDSHSVSSDITSPSTNESGGGDAGARKRGPYRKRIFVVGEKNAPAAKKVKPYYEQDREDNERAARNGNLDELSFFGPDPDKGTRRPKSLDDMFVDVTDYHRLPKKIRAGLAEQEKRQKQRLGLAIRNYRTSLGAGSSAKRVRIRKKSQRHVELTPEQRANDHRRYHKLRRAKRANSQSYYRHGAQALFFHKAGADSVVQAGTVRSELPKLTVESSEGTQSSCASGDLEGCDYGEEDDDVEEDEDDDLSIDDDLSSAACASSTSTMTSTDWAHLSRDASIRQVYLGIRQAFFLAKLDPRELHPSQHPQRQLSARMAATKNVSADAINVAAATHHAFDYEIKPKYQDPDNAERAHVEVARTDDLLRRIEWKTYMRQNWKVFKVNEIDPRSSTDPMDKLSSLRVVPRADGDDEESSSSELLLPVYERSINYDSSEDDEDEGSEPDDEESDLRELAELERKRGDESNHGRVRARSRRDTGGSLLSTQSSAVSATRSQGYLDRCPWTALCETDLGWTQLRKLLNIDIPIAAAISRVDQQTEPNGPERLELLLVKQFDTSFRLPVPHRVAQAEYSNRTHFQVLYRQQDKGMIPKVTVECPIKTASGNADPLMHYPEVIRMLDCSAHKFDLDAAIDNACSDQWDKYATVSAYAPRQNSTTYTDLLNLVAAAESSHQISEQVKCALFGRFSLSDRIKTDAIQRQRTKSQQHQKLTRDALSVNYGESVTSEDVHQWISQIHGSNGPTVAT